MVSKTKHDGGKDKTGCGTFDNKGAQVSVSNDDIYL